VYTCIKCWMRWLEGAGGAYGSCVRDGGGPGQLCQIIWWMMVMGNVLRVTGGVPDLAL